MLGSRDSLTRRLTRRQFLSLGGVTVAAFEQLLYLSERQLQKVDNR
jgi:hypothetical protein